ncbi:hypothetical protein HDU93_006011 [Gonapodya sp. JEL0774]|nr:hypothetical protein HDU93_006011 [Gonapodya sp. JEL0774]
MSALTNFSPTTKKIKLAGREFPLLSLLVPSLESCEELEALAVEQCAMIDLDSKVPPFRHLKRLSLKGNLLSGGLESLTELKHLEVLDLSDKKVPTGPASGFRPIADFQTSPFLEHTGPFYFRLKHRIDDESIQLVIGMRILPHHLNSRGGVHGGLFSTMADVCHGYQMSISLNGLPQKVSVDFGVGGRHLPSEARRGENEGATSKERLTTSSMTLDFVGNAKLGDWVEGYVDVQKIGGSMAFSNLYLCRIPAELEGLDMRFSESSEGDLRIPHGVKGSPTYGFGERIIRASAIFFRSASARGGTSKAAKM